MTERKYKRIIKKLENIYTQIRDNQPNHKREEYVNKAIEGYEQDFDKCEIFSMRTCYKDGYEQGQKEECCLCHYYSDFDKLKKENEELKAINKSLTEENNILVKDLGCETCSIHLEYKNLNNQIEKLKAQIEKMKRCGNCKNKQIRPVIKNKNDNKYVYQYTCKGLNICFDMKCNKWELSEN